LYYFGSHLAQKTNSYFGDKMENLKLRKTALQCPACGDFLYIAYPMGQRFLFCQKCKSPRPEYDEGSFPLKIKRLGDISHDEYPITADDILLGANLSYFIGIINHKYNDSSMFQWTQVARALRVHGLKIAEVK